MNRIRTTTCTFQRCFSYVGKQCLLGVMFLLTSADRKCRYMLGNSSLKTAFKTFILFIRSSLFGVWHQCAANEARLDLVFFYFFMCSFFCLFLLFLLVLFLLFLFFLLFLLLSLFSLLLLSCSCSCSFFARPPPPSLSLSPSLSLPPPPRLPPPLPPCLYPPLSLVH